MSIKERISFVKETIDTVCRKIGKTSEDITLMAVTKKVDPVYINEAIDAGITVIGENRVQEAREKFEKVKKGIKWHMIGPLQVNKVKYAIHIFDMIQSLESIKLAEEIEKRAAPLDKIVPVLIEVKISFEETKHGIMPQELIPFLEQVSTYKHIKVKGLMTMAPFFDDKEKTRPYFRKVKELFDKIKSMNITNIDMEILSMGMSSDFEVAIEEGSNFVRIGRAIFEDVYK
jgi:pyridoxal phosphate enzyme (YggS family)